MSTYKTTAIYLPFGVSACARVFTFEQLSAYSCPLSAKVKRAVLSQLANVDGEVQRTPKRVAENVLKWMASAGDESKMPGPNPQQLNCHRCGIPVAGATALQMHLLHSKCAQSAMREALNIVGANVTPPSAEPPLSQLQAVPQSHQQPIRSIASVASTPSTLQVAPVTVVTLPRGFKVLQRAPAPSTSQIRVSSQPATPSVPNTSTNPNLRPSPWQNNSHLTISGPSNQIRNPNSNVQAQSIRPIQIHTDKVPIRFSTAMANALVSQRPGLAPNKRIIILPRGSNVRLSTAKALRPMQTPAAAAPTQRTMPSSAAATDRVPETIDLTEDSLSPVKKLPLPDLSASEDMDASSGFPKLISGSVQSLNSMPDPPRLPLPVPLLPRSPSPTLTSQLLRTANKLTEYSKPSQIYLQDTPTTSREADPQIAENIHLASNLRKTCEAPLIPYSTYFIAEEDNWVCLHCPGSTFKTSSRRRILHHVKQKHLKYEHLCQVCHRVFRSLLSLERHMSRVHREAGRQSDFVCLLCGLYETSRPANAVLHVAKCLVVNGYECDKCPEKFYSEADLNKHLVCVHGSQPNNQTFGLSIQNVETLAPPKRISHHPAVDPTELMNAFRQANLPASQEPTSNNELAETQVTEPSPPYEEEESELVTDIKQEEVPDFISAEEPESAPNQPDIATENDDHDYSSFRSFPEPSTSAHGPSVSHQNSYPIEYSENPIKEECVSPDHVN